jgi:hypothetical protein
VGEWVSECVSVCVCVCADQRHGDWCRLTYRARCIVHDKTKAVERPRLQLLDPCLLELAALGRTVGHLTGLVLRGKWVLPGGNCASDTDAQSAHLLQEGYESGV